jgi:hypothetical protein
MVRIIRGEASGVQAKNVIVNPNCKYRACVPCLFYVAKNKIRWYNALVNMGRCVQFLIEPKTPPLWVELSKYLLLVYIKPMG